MKIACSSAAFARLLETGELSQLEWLDLCAHELEVGGVLFEARHFPRTDDEYLAQLKKMAVDLGLTIAGLGTDALFAGAERAWLDVALRLGAPLVVAHAPQAGDDSDQWGRFAAAAKALASACKYLNLTLAVRNRAQTLCADAADLKRLAKDVDSAWLRFAPEVATFGRLAALDTILPKAVIALHAIGEPDTFATAGDAEAPLVIERLQRFRGFIAFERGADGGPPQAFHAALERFSRLRERALSSAPEASR